MLLDQDFAPQLALSQGREMLAQTSLRNTIIKLEDKDDHNEKTTTTPVHGMSAAEPTFSHSELAAGIGLAETKAESKTGVVDGDEKPTWEEVMQSTTDVSSLLADEAPSLGVPQADDDSLVLLASQQKHRGHDDSNVTTGPSGGYECASASVLQIDALLQKAMVDLKTEMNEAVNVASAMQQSRMDSRMDSLDASLDAVGGKLQAQFSEQGRTGERLGDLERTIQRLEQLLLKSVNAGSATAQRPK